MLEPSHDALHAAAILCAQEFEEHNNSVNERNGGKRYSKGRQTGDELLSLRSPIREETNRCKCAFLGGKDKIHSDDKSQKAKEAANDLCLQLERKGTFGTAKGEAWSKKHLTTFSFRRRKPQGQNKANCTVG